MDVWTGYYAQMKKYVKADLVPVSIAYGTPVWYMGETCFELAPSRKLLVSYKKGLVDQEEYTKQYLQFLKTVDWSLTIGKLFDISDKHQGKDLVLCCFEKPDDFCHRHLLAEYLTKHGMDVEEYLIGIN